MKVYLASSFDLVPTVESVSDYLEVKGHTIVVKWWSTDGFDLRDKKMDYSNPEEFYEDAVCRQIYLRDLNGIVEADALVLIAGDIPKKFNGANVEYGIALGLRKPCFSIGTLENSAMYFPIQRCHTLGELARGLSVLKSQREDVA